MCYSLNVIVLGRMEVKKSQRKKFPNTDFFLILTSLYSNWRGRFTSSKNSEKTPYLDIFHAVNVYTFVIWITFCHPESDILGIFYIAFIEISDHKMFQLILKSLLTFTYRGKNYIEKNSKQDIFQKNSIRL